jgi:hypothetical protein
MAPEAACDYDERPAIARIRWTVYGGAPKYARVCAHHWSVCRGQRGVDVYVGDDDTFRGQHVRGWIGSDRYQPSGGRSAT